jgi:hypothetical protein
MTAFTTWLGISLGLCRLGVNRREGTENIPGDNRGSLLIR